MKGIYLVCLLFFLSGIFLSLGFMSSRETTKYISPSYNESEIDFIANEVANIKPYEVNVWDCSDMTDELVYRLRRRGYDARYIHGLLQNTNEFCLSDKGCEDNQKCVNQLCYTPHAWTRVVLNIESTTGERIRKQKLRENYIEKYEKGVI